jgi:hypothetical protein
MKCGATTAFLPNFAAFPSLGGLSSSTVQPRRAPRGDGVRRWTAPRNGTAGSAPGADPAVADTSSPDAGAGCPVSAAPSTASAAAPAGRPASAGRATTAGRSPGGARRAGPAAASAATRPPAVAAPAATAGAHPPRGPARGAHDRDQQHEKHRQDDADDHGVTLLSFPRDPPKRPPVGASLTCVTGRCPPPVRPKAELRNF